MVTSSSVTGDVNGAYIDTAVIALTPNSFQLGMSSSSPLVWNTLPDRICAPIYGPFSMRHTDKSMLFFSASYLILMAADNPIGGNEQQTYQQDLLQQ